MSSDPSQHDLEELKRKLLDYNFSQVGSESYQGLMVLLRDVRGNLAGGLAGKIYYHWLFIEWFWIAEAHRKHGHGRTLLARAEQEARDRGCRQAWLDTFSFQAFGFYEKNGYVRFGELSDYPPGHKRYFLCKELGVEKS